MLKQKHMGTKQGITQRSPGGNLVCVQSGQLPPRAILDLYEDMSLTHPQQEDIVQGSPSVIWGMLGKS